MIQKFLLPVTLALLATVPVFGQNDESNDSSETAKWDVNDPSGPYKEISFTTDEGTWMSVDVSPDGQTLLFDLLGDIYTMPISGGDARRLTSGQAYNSAPRFSPDGRRISHRHRAQHTDRPALQ